MKVFKQTIRKNEQRSWAICYGLCKSCGLCVEKCPVKCIEWSRTEKGIYGSPSVEVAIEKCISCKTCEIICPEAAIKIQKNV